MRNKINLFRRNVAYILCLAFFPVMLVGTVNYIIDPLQIYRKQEWVTPRFWSEQRSQNAGKIRSYLVQDGYDSVIIGNSVADNFKASRVAKVMGWKKTMKLTVSAGHASEQLFMLQNALDKADIKHVLWCIRAVNYQESQKKWHPTRSIPFYLYTESLLDDTSYLFSLDMLLYSHDLFFKSKWIDNLDNLNYWQANKNLVEQIVSFSRKKDKKVSRKNKIPNNLKLANDSTSVQYHILDLVKKYPKVNFIVMIAPQTMDSIEKFNINDFSHYYGCQAELVRKGSNFSNLKIFGFEDQAYIVCNKANYRDHLHYHSGVNELMLQCVVSGNNQINSKNFNNYVGNIINLRNNFKSKSDFATMVPLALAEENIILQDFLLFSDCKDIGRRLIKNNRYSEAILVLTKWLAGTDQDSVRRSEIYAMCGDSYSKLGKVDLAIDAYSQAIKHVPNKSILYIKRGDLYSKLNKFKDEEKDYQKFLDLQPTHYRGYQLLSKIFVRKNEFQKAIEMISRAIQRASRNSSLYLERGNIYKLFGDDEMARRDFDSARAMSPSMGYRN